jgi:methylase of polypeptide subunit release factors
VNRRIPAPPPDDHARYRRARRLSLLHAVLATVLAHRGVARVVATDADPRAVACAAENLERLGFGARTEVVLTDLFPPGRAPLVVANPPWLPGRPRTPLDHAVYDPSTWGCARVRSC